MTDEKVRKTGRNPDGTFKKGEWPGGPGRPKKAQAEAMLDAINAAMPPDKVRSIMAKALSLAEEQNSARSLLKVLEFAAGYLIGTPVQRSEDASDGYEALAALMAGEDNANKDGD